ncbi:MAG: hypothetical protein ACJ8DC_19380 [Gemmatimonadales bacterium]
MQPAELVAIMASIIYSGRRDQLEEVRPETRQSAVEEAWQLWHLTMDEWSDPGIRRLDRPMMEP